MTIHIEEHCICGQSLTGTFKHLSQEEADEMVAEWWDLHTGEGHGKA